MSDQISSLITTGKTRATRAWTTGGEAANLEQTVVQVVSSSTESPGLNASARLAQAASCALKEHPKERIALLRAALDALNAQALGGAGFQIQFAYTMLDALSDSFRRSPDRNRLIRVMLDSMATTAEQQSRPEADYLRFCARLGEHTPFPMGSLNMTTRLGMKGIDVTRPSWWATTCFSHVGGLDSDPAADRQMVALTLEELRARGDAPLQGLIAQYDTLVRSGRDPHKLALGLLRAAGAELRPGSASLLVLQNALDQEARDAAWAQLEHHPDPPGTWERGWYDLLGSKRQDFVEGLLVDSEGLQRQLTRAADCFPHRLKKEPEAVERLVRGYLTLETFQDPQPALAESARLWRRIGLDLEPTQRTAVLEQVTGVLAERHGIASGLLNAPAGDRAAVLDLVLQVWSGEADPGAGLLTGLAPSGATISTTSERVVVAGIPVPKRRPRA